MNLRIVHTDLTKLRFDSANECYSATLLILKYDVTIIKGLKNFASLI